MSATAEALAVWVEVRAWLAEARPDLAAELRTGAGDEALAELAALGLPESWRAWWHHNDGAGPVLFDGWSWLPVRGVVDSVLSEYEALIEMAVQLENEAPPTAVGPVRPVWGHRDWVPFAVDYSGRFLCVDLAPADGGQRGQVILVDDDERRVLYDGLQSFLSDCLMRMEMGVHPDDETDPDSDEWIGEASFPPAPGPEVAKEGPPASAPTPAPQPPAPAAPSEPARAVAPPPVRAQAEPTNGGAMATIPLDVTERAEGATVFVRQLGGDIVGVRVPAGAWDGARLVLPGLGGEGRDLVLVVAVAS